MKTTQLYLTEARPPAATASLPTAARSEVLAVYEAHYTSFVRLAILLGNDRHTAEDLVHEAFIKLHSHWGRLDDRSRAPGYVRSTIVNLSRGRRRRQAIGLRKVIDAPGVAPSAEEAVLARERRDSVVAALGRLSGRQRECLVLRHYGQLTESEIADAVGVSVGSVRTHVRRGLERLQEELQTTHQLEGQR